jgi:sulfoacetaldehyde dehydrogenase
VSVTQAGRTPTAGAPESNAIVAALVSRARAAQRAYERYDQTQVDEVVTAAAWAILEPGRCRLLAETAVRDTGLGDVDDKFRKNRRKTLGLLRDLRAARSVGVVAEYPEQGLIEIARPVGVVAALVPSTNPAATPINNILNALKGRNAIILSPSPKGSSTCTQLLSFVHAELDRVGAPRDLVQQLPAPVTKALTEALMRQADLVVATGSQSNVRAAYASGTPAIGVGVGNVPVIVDASADLTDAAAKIATSKCFDHATSCSSENSLIVLDAVYGQALEALGREGGVLLDAGEKQQLQAAMWVDGHLSPRIVAHAAPEIARVAGLTRPALARARFLLVAESGIGRDHPFSGEKLSPVLTLYRARDFDAAVETTRRLLWHQGAGHSCGIHTRDDAHVLRLGLELPVCRVIVNQAHAIATGGSFDNGLPFSLSMGCGTWGRNSISDNLNYRHFLNTTRIVRTIPAVEPSEDELLGAYRAKYGV